VSRHRLPVLAAAGGVIAGLALTALIVADWGPEPETVTGEAAEQAFVAAWERSRLGTYYVAREIRRTTPSGELESVHELAQRPPDVMRRQFGAVDGRIGNRPITCTVDPEDQERCAQGSGELPSYEDEVAEEIARWDNYFVGTVPLYWVEMRADGCFDLRLTRLSPSPPYGNWSRFCFDEATGAMVYAEIHRDEGTDLLEAVEVRAQVSDADFAVSS
jgi:hypothetical protein